MYLLCPAGEETGLSPPGSERAGRSRDEKKISNWPSETIILEPHAEAWTGWSFPGRNLCDGKIHLS